MKKFHSLNNYTELSSEQLNQTVGGNWWNKWTPHYMLPKRTAFQNTNDTALT